MNFLIKNSDMIYKKKTRNGFLKRLLKSDFLIREHNEPLKGKFKSDYLIKKHNGF